MSVDRCFVHIGLPKCASTSLQDALSRAEGIHYAGMLPQRPEGAYWRSDELALLFDRELRFACAEPEHYRRLVADFIAAGGERPAVFSSENLTLRFLPWDLPTHIKLDYLARLFPPHCRFIYVYRDPLAVLASLYKEWVMLGYRRSYAEFAAEAFRFRDISFFHDLCLGRFLQLFDASLGLDRLELVSLDQGDAGEQLSAILGVPLSLPAQPLNPSLDWRQTQLVRELNADLRDFDPFFDSIEYHRAFFDLEDEARKYATARRRRRRKAVAQELAPYAAEPQPEAVAAEILDYLIDDLESARGLLPATAPFAATIDRYLEELHERKR